MNIDGVNTAMTALQWSRARLVTRSVETAGGAGNYHPQARHGVVVLGIHAADHGFHPPEPLVHLPEFRWTYRPHHVNGKVGAKRHPQVADTKYWSMMAVDEVA